MPPRALPLRIRFQRYYQETSSCWNWTGAISPYGYGCFGISSNRRAEHAHRVSYRLYVGPIPEGMFVLHRCDNRRCVNPKHLLLGTQEDNMDDMMAKGRRAYGDKVANKGEANPRAKLTEQQVRRIRRLKGRLQSRIIARIYGIEKSAVLRIWNGKLWRSVK